MVRCLMWWMLPPLCQLVWLTLLRHQVQAIIWGKFKDDMDARGPVRVADVEDAQKKIMRLARKLSDSGELILGGADFV